MIIPSMAGQIHNAARYGSAIDIEAAIANGEDVNSTVNTNTGELFPLHLAVFGGNLKAVEFLLNSGASINAITLAHGSPLHIASLEGREEIVKLLLDRHADVNIQDHAKFTPLHNAAQCGNHNIAKLLLDFGANINSADNQLGITPLVQAIMAKSYNVVDILLSYGASQNCKEANGNSTLLFTLMHYGDNTIINLLMKHCNDCDSQLFSNYMARTRVSCVSKNKSYENMNVSNVLHPIKPESSTNNLIQKTKTKIIKPFDSAKNFSKKLKPIII